MAKASRTAVLQEMDEFHLKCLQKLDCQVFEFESEEAKLSAIQAVQRVLREIADIDGEEEVLKIIRYPRRILLPGN